MLLSCQQKLDLTLHNQVSVYIYTLCYVCIWPSEEGCCLLGGRLALILASAVSKQKHIPVYRKGLVE